MLISISKPSFFKESMYTSKIDSRQSVSGFLCIYTKALQRNVIVLIIWCGCRSSDFTVRSEDLIIWKIERSQALTVRMISWSEDLKIWWFDILMTWWLDHLTISWSDYLMHWRSDDSTSMPLEQRSRSGQIANERELCACLWRSWLWHLAWVFLRSSWSKWVYLWIWYRSTERNLRLFDSQECLYEAPFFLCVHPFLPFLLWASF